jgi:hypothetical protein
MQNGRYPFAYLKQPQFASLHQQQSQQPELQQQGQRDNDNVPFSSL